MIYNEVSNRVGEGFNREKFKQNIISDPEKRYSLYQDLFQGDSEKPSWEEFSSVMLEGSSDKGFEDNELAYAYSPEGIRKIDKNTGLVTGERVVEELDPVEYTKSIDVNYQNMTNLLGKERADELFELNAYDRPDVVSKLAYEDKKQQEFKEWQKTNPNGTFQQFERGNRDYINDEVMKLYQDQNEQMSFGGSDFWGNRVLPDDELQEQANNLVINKLYKAKNKVKETYDLLQQNPESEEAKRKYNEALKEERDYLYKYSQDTDEQASQLSVLESQMANSQSDNIKSYTVGIQELANLSKIIFQDDPNAASEWVSGYLDRSLGREYEGDGSYLDVQYGALPDVTLSPNEALELDKRVDEAKSIIAARNNQKAVDYSAKDYASAIDEITTSSAFVSDYQENLSDEDNFFLIYRKMFDQFKALEEELGGREGMHSRHMLSEVNFGDDEDAYRKYFNLEEQLKEHYPLFALNIAEYDAKSEGFIDSVKKFGLALPQKITNELYSSMYGVDKYDTKVSRLKDLTRNNPEVASKAIGEFKEDTDFATNVEGSYLPDYDELAEAGGVAAKMMLEMPVGSAALSLLGRATKATQLLSRISNMEYARLAPALRTLQRSGRIPNTSVLKWAANNPMAAKHFLGAAKRGGQFQLAGTIFNDTDNMNFASGLAGYAGGAISEKLLGNTIGKIANFFGQDSPKIAQAIINYGQKGARMAGGGIAEGVEEEFENVVNAALESSSMKSYLEKIEKQYGSLSDVSKRFMTSVFIGSLMNGTGLGNTLTSKAEKMYGDAKASLAGTHFDIKNNQEALKDAEQMVKMYDDQVKMATDALNEAADAANLNQANIDGTQEKIDNVADNQKKAKVQVEENEGKVFDIETEQLVKEVDKDTISKLNELKSNAEESLKEAERVEDQKNTEVVDSTSEAIKTKATENKEFPKENKKGKSRNIKLNRSDLSKASSIAIKGINRGKTLNESIEEASKEIGVNPHHLKRVMANELSKKTSNRVEEGNPEIDQLIEDVADMQEEGTLFDNIDEGVVLTQEDGTEVEGDLEISVDGDIMFKPKGKRKGLNLGNENEVGGQYLAEVGLSKTNSAGEEISRKRKSTGEKNKYVARNFPKERKAFNTFNKKAKELKAKKDSGKITEDSYNNQMQTAKTKLNDVVPDISNQITEESDLDAFNDLLLSERASELNNFYKDRSKARKKFLTEKAREVAKEGKEKKKQLKEKISEFKEKQKTLEQEKAVKENQKKSKEQKLKEAEDKYTTIYGEGKTTLYKEDGSAMSNKEVKIEFEEAIKAKDTARILAAINATPRGEMDLKMLGDSVNAVNNDPVSQSLLAEAFSEAAFEFPEPVKQENRKAKDYQAARGTLPLIGNKSGSTVLHWIANKIGLSDSTTNKIKEFTSVGGLMNNMHPDLYARLEFYKDDLILKEKKASDAVNDLKKKIDKYKKDNGIKKTDNSLEEKVNDALKGLTYEGIPENIVEQIKVMQEMINSYASDLAELGLIDEGAFVQMQQDGTFYMTNTYKRDYKDGDWEEKFEEKLENGDFDNARELIRKQNSEQDRDGFNSKTIEEQNQQIDDELRGIAMNPKQLIDININMDALASSNKNLKRRKDIDEAIQEVMGIEKNPYVNFINSVANQAKLIEGYNRQADIVEYGLENGLIEEISIKDKKDAQEQIGKAKRRGWVVPKKTPPTLYGDKVYAIESSFYDVLDAYGDSIMASDRNPAVDAWRKTISFHKKLNTVYSPASHVSNVAGALSTVMSNGHVNPVLANEGIKTALYGTWLGDSMGIKDVDNTFKDALTQYGIMDSGMSAEISNTLKKAKQGLSPEQYKTLEKNLSEGKVKDVMSAIASLAKGFNSKTMNVYQMTDNIARAIGFTHEVAFAAEMSNEFKDDYDHSKSKVENIRDFIKTDAGRQAMADAKRKVDATYPTYSKVPRGIRWVSENLPFGTFVSFPAESIRTSYNMWMLGAGEIKQARTDNTLDDRQKALLVKKGAKRISSALGIQALFVGLASLSASAIGLTPDEEEEVKKMLPEWYRNSNLFWYKSDEGDIRFIDLDRYNSYGLPLAIAKQLKKGNVGEAIDETFKPFGSMNMTAQTLYEIWEGESVSGRTIRNERDSVFNNTMSSLSHVLKTSGSIAKFMTKMAQAQFGEGKDYNGENIPYHDYYGDEIDMGNEFKRLFGISSQKLKAMPERLLSRERKDYRENRKTLNKIKNKDIGYDNIDTVNRIHKSIIKDMRERYQGMVALNDLSDKPLTEDELNSAIAKSAGMSKEEFEKQVVFGEDRIYDIDENGKEYFKEVIEE